MNEDLFALYGGEAAQLLSIDLMEGHDFEFWCAGLLKNIGFTHVEVTPGSNDHGVDILARKDGIHYAIQCKRYSHDLGNTPIQEVHAGKSMYNCHVGVVLTNQYFTKGARDLARATGVLLWDRAWIQRNLSVVNTDDPISHDTLDDDSLFADAVDLILETQQATVSMLQQRLKIGYARAARLVDIMEDKGIIGPFQGSKPRAILISQEDWDVQMGRSKKFFPDHELEPMHTQNPPATMVEIAEPSHPEISKHAAPLLCFLSVCIPFLKVCIERGFLTGSPAEIISDIICTIAIPLLITYLCIFKNPQGRFYQKWWFWFPLFLCSFSIK